MIEYVCLYVVLLVTKGKKKRHENVDMYVQQGHISPPPEKVDKPRSQKNEGKIDYIQVKPTYDHVRDLRGSVASCRRH